MKKILFITQHLERTGSEMVLWHLLNNLDPQKYSLYVFCMTKGELYDHLPPHIQKSVVYKNSGQWKLKKFKSLLNLFKINPFEYQLKQIQKEFKPDVWYINTIVIPHVARMGNSFDVKVITHFHELLHAFTFVQHDELKKIITSTDTCIACSEEVKDRVTEMGHRKVRIQNSFIDTKTIHVDPQRVDEIKKELGILPADFVWVISGVATYMKGLDYIIPLLDKFNQLPVKIIWIGRVLNTGLDYYVKQVSETKYPGKFLFTGALFEDYYNYLAVGNGFLMLSREESFSLVMLEAAYLGIPIVAVEAGIAKGFIQEGMGKITKGSKVGDITEAMEWLHNHPQQNPEKLRESAMAYTVETQLPQYEALMAEIIHEQGR